MLWVLCSFVDDGKAAFVRGFGPLAGGDDPDRTVYCLCSAGEGLDTAEEDQAGRDRKETGLENGAADVGARVTERTRAQGVAGEYVQRCILGIWAYLFGSGRGTQVRLEGSASRVCSLCAAFVLIRRLYIRPYFLMQPYCLHRLSLPYPLAYRSTYFHLCMVREQV